MTKALQKKFVVTAMIAISVLLVALLGAINIGNAVITARQTDFLLDALLESETPFSPIPMQPAPGRGGLFAAPMTEDDKLSARYFVAVLDSHGQLMEIDTSRIASVTKQEASEIALRVCQSGEAAGKESGFRFKALSIPSGMGTVYVFLDTSAQSISVVRVLLLSVMLGIVCWGLMLLLVILLSKKAIRPIAAGMERQRQFVTDAGHEIKTPLAIIMANTAAMELISGENKWSKNIREQTVRLSGLMHNLLALSKIDEYSIDSTKVLLSASDITEKTVQMFRPSMELRHQSLDEQIAPGITVSANEELFTRLVSILLDNAVKYTPEGGHITVTLTAAGKAVHLSVQNDCASLPDCPPDKLFDRFYRADAARTQKSGGYGIGLSAARSITEVHGGTIAAQYLGEHTIAFHVKL